MDVKLALRRYVGLYSNFRDCDAEPRIARDLVLQAVEARLDLWCSDSVFGHFHTARPAQLGKHREPEASFATRPQRFPCGDL